MKILIAAVTAGVTIVVTAMIIRSAARLSSSREASPSVTLHTLDEVSHWLEAEHRLAVRHYSTFDFGREKDESNISVVVSERRAHRILPDLRDYLGPGLVAFIGTTRWLGHEHHSGVELVVAPGESQFDMLRAARSDAVNFGIETEELIERLQGLHERYNFAIFHAETDTIEFTFESLPKDVRPLAEEIYELCPDIVDQGCGSVEALAKGIRDTRMVLLWWD